MIRPARLVLLLTLLLLTACVTQRKAEEYFDKNTDELAEYVDKNTVYTEKYGEQYAAKHFPARVTPPAIERKVNLMPERLVLMPEQQLANQEKRIGQPVIRCPECKTSHTKETVYLKDTAALDALRVELNNERQAHNDTKQKLSKTAKERDYWQEKNSKKFWALIVMAAFAALFILFRVLADRVKVT